MVKSYPITIKEVDIFQKEDTLYISDFRGLSENFELEIPAYFKYENIFEHVQPKAYVTNDVHRSTSKIYKNYIAPVVTDPRITVLERLVATTGSIPFTTIWQTVPHPSSDKICSNGGIKNNYTYDAYLLKNNKISQKKLHPLSPEWEILSNKNYSELEKQYKNFYIKREVGSGGFMVFHHSEIQKSDVDRLMNDQSSKWYIEKEIQGTPHSVQILSTNNNHTIFGWAEQTISENKYFSGAKIKQIQHIPLNFLSFVNDSIQYLAPLLNDYSGFWGIDFIIDNNKKIHFLEANIRTTTLSIPTLLANATGKPGTYIEEISIDEIKTNDIFISSFEDLFDILRF